MNRRKTAPPKGILRSATADARHYQHERYHPSTDLEPYVEHFWSVQWDLRGRPPERAETLSHPSIHLIFERGAGARITGVVRKKFSRILEGQGGIIAAKFTPGGFYPFAKVPMSTLTDATVPMRDIFGADASRVEAAVLDAGANVSGIAIIEDFLRRRRPVPDAMALRIAGIVYAVAGDREIVKVEDLVDRFDLGKRTLQRLFSRYVGVTPKWVIQRYRLNEAAAALGADPSLSQSALAADLGYSDQAHFVRDFKAVVGTSPAAYARQTRV